MPNGMPSIAEHVVRRHRAARLRYTGTPSASGNEQPVQVRQATMRQVPSSQANVLSEKHVHSLWNAAVWIPILVGNFVGRALIQSRHRERMTFNLNVSVDAACNYEQLESGALDSCVPPPQAGSKIKRRGCERRPRRDKPSLPVTPLRRLSPSTFRGGEVRLQTCKVPRRRR